MKRGLTGVGAALGGIVLSMATLPALPGCEDHRTKAEDLEPVKSQKWSDLGQGIYTFEFNGFAKSLVDFKKNHPDLVITSMFAEKEGIHSLTESVVITTEPRASFDWQMPK